MAPAPPALKMALTQRAARRCACARRAERDWSFGGCLESAGGGEPGCGGRPGGEGSGLRGEGIPEIGGTRGRDPLSRVREIGLNRGWSPFAEGGRRDPWMGGWDRALFSRLWSCAAGGSAQIGLHVWKYTCGFKFSALMGSCG